MSEEPNRDTGWSIGLVLSAALHAGGLFYLVTHAKAPGATEIPTPAISVSLTPTKVFESKSETGAVETAGSGVIGQGGESAPQTETPDPAEEARLAEEVKELERRREEAEAREKAEAEERAKAEAEARAKAEAEAQQRAKAEAEARAKAEEEARALAEAREKAEIEARAKAEAEAREKAEAEARAKAEAEERERERAEAEKREQAEGERRKLAERRRKEAEEEEARERAEEERERRAEAEQRKKRQARAAGSLSSGDAQTPNRRETGRVSASTGELLNYNARVRAQVARNKPRGGSATGRVVFSIQLSESGQLIDVRIVRSSGNAALDQAALTAARRAAPYPSAPPGARPSDRLFHIPFDFK